VFLFRSKMSKTALELFQPAIYLFMRWIQEFFPGDKVDSPKPIAEVKNEKNYAFHPP